MMNFWIIAKKRVQKKIKMVGLIHRGWLAWLGSVWVQNPTKIKIVLKKKKYKDDQNGLIHPEN